MYLFNIFSPTGPTGLDSLHQHHCPNNCDGRKLKRIRCRWHGMALSSFSWGNDWWRLNVHMILFVTDTYYASSPDIHGLMISNNPTHFQVEAILRQLCSNRKVDKAGEEPKAVTFPLKGWEVVESDARWNSLNRGQLRDISGVSGLGLMWDVARSEAMSRIIGGQWGISAYLNLPGRPTEGSVGTWLSTKEAGIHAIWHAISQSKTHKSPEGSPMGTQKSRSLLECV